jgi:hypothetical protein
MTTVQQPAPAGTGFDWRQAYLRPPNVELVVGPGQPACPLDDVFLLPREGGWYCPTCFGGWDAYGRHGQWLAIRDAVLRAAAERRLRLVEAVNDGLGDRRCDDEACRGRCGNCRVNAGDVQEHDDVDTTAAARLRRIDLTAAAAIGGGVVMAGAYELGRQLPEHVVPENVLWVLVGVLGGAELLGLAVAWWNNRRAARLAGDDAGVDVAGVEAVIAAEIAGRVRDGA